VDAQINVAASRRPSGPALVSQQLSAAVAGADRSPLHIFNHRFEKIETCDIVLVSRRIEARLMRRDSGRDKPCTAQ
jgi:hypothetical protein